jgi:hypothetical protein
VGEVKLNFQAHQPGLKGGNMPLDLSAPKVITFGVAVVIALISAIIHYAHLSVPVVHSGFTLLFVGFLVLAAGNLLRGL